MSKEQKQNPSSGAHSSKAKSNYDGQECESLRLGHQARTKEKVVDAVENKTVHAKARQARFDSNGENPAPGPKDVAAERAKTASKGSKSRK